MRFFRGFLWALLLGLPLWIGIGAWVWACVMR